MLGAPGEGSLAGDGLAFLAALAFAVMIVITRWRHDVSMAPATCLSQAILVVAFLPFASPGEIGGDDVVWLAALGIGQIGLGFALLTVGARLIPAAQVGLITLLEVVLGPLWVWLALDERPSTLTLVGGAIVIVAIVIQTRGGAGARGPGTALGPELFASPFRERADDEGVGVLDQVAHELVGQAAVERDRVPVALVEVVARADRGMSLAEADRELRLALDAHFERREVQPAQREHLAGDLEHRWRRTEREVLDRPGLSQAPCTQVARIHGRIVAPGRSADLDQAVAGSSMRRGSSVSRAMTSRWICDVPS